jgi:small GTP-binding protein
MSSELKLNELKLTDKITPSIKIPEIKPEIRIGVLGNVDSGKSSTIGVITKNVLDDGKGYARSLVMRHPHEKESGRTSDISQLYIQNDNLIIDFVDLAGHEKYLKTTMYGVSGYLIDYALIVINANTGIQRMTREHIGLVLSLKIPIIIIYTKLDIAPPNIIKDNLNKINDFFHRKTKKNVVIMKDDNNYTTILNNFKAFNFKKIPLFPISNVNGNGIESMKSFINNLRVLVNYQDRYNKPPNFIIDRKYVVAGIGLVISGVVKFGTIHKGDVLFLGPFTNNQYYRITIRSIHNNFRQPIDTLYAGQGGCLNIKSVSTKINIKRNMIKKGARIVSDCQTYKKFTSRVKILHHPTTITKRYQPTIHCGPVSQCARIINMDKEYLRSHDEATVTFEFMYRPEIIEKGCHFVFREGMTKGIGVVDDVIPYVSSK